MGASRNDIPPELDVALTGEENPARLRALWSAMGETGTLESPPPGADAAWRELVARLDERPRVMRRGAPDRSALVPRARRRWRAASGVVTLVVLALVAAWWLVPVEIRVEAGSQQVVTLPDGSSVEMNSATRLRYRRAFASIPFFETAERRVRLSGEAFFDVIENGRAFVVETADARVEVLGTRFNVRSRSIHGGSRTVITLEEGRLRISPRAAENAPVIVDSTGAVAVGRAGAVRLAGTEAALDHALAWRNHGFAVVNEPIGDILQEVRRRFAVDVRIEGDLPVHAPMTVFYLRGATAEQIIHDVCLARGWHYRETSRGFAVFGAKDSAGSSADGGRG